MSVFEYDVGDVRRLVEQFRKAPKLFGRAAAAVLNDLAFEAKNKYVLESLEDNMELRDLRFVKSRIRVQKARARSRLSDISAQVGSVSDKPRFTAWEENETGKRTKRTRTMGLAARRGSKRNKSTPRSRLRSSQYKGPEAMGGKSAQTKSETGLANAWLAWLFRNKYKKPFILHGHGTIAAGLFSIKGGRLVRLQYFKRRRSAQPTRVRWMEKAGGKLMRSTNPIARWDKAVGRINARWR